MDSVVEKLVGLVYQCDGLFQLHMQQATEWKDKGVEEGETKALTCAFNAMELRDKIFTKIKEL